MTPNPANRLTGKAAIVTGAGSRHDDGTEIGIGSAIARLLARAGASVLLVDRDSEAGAHTVALIEQEGGTARLFLGDVADPRSCEKAVAACVAEFGKLDILVNNAAVLSAIPAIDMTDEEWTRVLDVNLKSVMFMSKYALERMTGLKPGGGEGGSIVNISSASGMRSFSNSAYAASKSGILGLTGDMAGTYGRQGVRVNAVIPGTVDTPMARRMSKASPSMAPSPINSQMRLKSNPLETVGTGWDVAWAVLYLAGDEARWVTGAAIPVDAGMLVAATLPTMRHLLES